MLGGLLALISAATFAFSNVSSRRGVITGSVVQGLAISIPIGVPLFAVLALAMGSLSAVTEFERLPFTYLCLAGAFHFTAGRYCNYRAINAIGANLTAPVQQTGLLFSLAIAIAFLGEVLTPLRILGIVMMLVGPTIMVPGPSADRRLAKASTAGAPRPDDGAASGFRPRYAEGYAYAALSAIAYGISPVLIRAALHNADAGASIAGGLISYAAATVVLLPFVLSRGTLRHIGAMRATAGKWFTFAGIFTCVSQMIRYVALSLAPVTVVTPIMRTSIVFLVVFGWFVNRDHEVFGLRMRPRGLRPSHVYRNRRLAGRRLGPHADHRMGARPGFAT
jgi:uncharacterized membrane protein